MQIPKPFEPLRKTGLSSGLDAAIHGLTSRDRSIERESFRDFVGRAYPGFRWYKHSEVIAGGIQRLMDGEIKKLFVAAPPQSGKSLLSKLAAAYRLSLHPELWVGVSSYGSSLANKISRAVRDMSRRTGTTLRGDASAVETWELPQGGGLWAYGVGGGQTGNPANFLLLDDAVKNAAEASSPTFQSRNDDWYGTAWKSRWNSFGGPLLEMMIGTRWDVKDLQGFVLEQGGWHCIILPAIYEEVEVPEGNTLEPDWREIGEPLCPELAKFTVEWLDQERRNLRAKRFAALYQQQPQPDEGGGYFQDWWFPILGQDPATVPKEDGQIPGERAYSASCRAWDLAATQDGGDKTAGVLMGRLRSSGRIVVRDSKSARLGPGGVKRLIAQTMVSDGPDVVVSIPQDPGQAGKAQVAEYVRFLRDEARKAGIRPPDVRSSPTSGSKTLRAEPFAAACEPVSGGPDQFVPGNVDIVRGPWNAEFLQVLHGFDGIEGHADDEVDAVSDAYKQVTATHEWRTF